MADLKIKDAPVAGSASGTDKIPVSQGTNQATTITINQANKVHEDKADPHTQYLLESEASTTYEPKNANIQQHISSTSNPHSVTATQVGLGNVLNATQEVISAKGQALGYCPLDGGAKVSETYLPDSVLGQVDYQGTWNATTNTPTIPAADSTNKGHYYIVAVSGTTNVDGITDWTIGDWIISNGDTWNKVDNTDSVSSVFGRAGAIVANAGDYNASQITNTPAGNIAAVTVQAAINELDTEKADKSGKLSQFAATTSAELAGVVSDETGSGSLVFASSPTLVTPTIGAATATSVNRVVITVPATGSTLTIADGKTLTASNTLTLAGTDGSTLNVSTGGTLGTAAYTPATDYAVAANGVTNGDSHDHSGGDGAQIAYSSLSGLPSLGTIASQAANNVAVTGGTINGTAIGGTTPAAGAFTTVSATGAVQLATSTGNLLIGTTTDDGVNKLQVAGSIKATSSLYSNGGGGVASNSCTGFQALYNNTTGNCNTANGYLALLSNTTGSGNTANGIQALYYNTTGGGNTANGLQALYYNTTGGGNTANGYLALLSNTTGSGNICIGSLTSAGAYAPVFDCTTENNRVVIGSTSVTNAYINVAWTVVSDQRDKTNIVDIPKGLDFVSRLNPVQYERRLSREEETGDGITRYGFLAQDILAIEGDKPVIVDAEDADRLKLNDANLLAVVVKALQELNAKLDAHIQGA